MLESGSTNGVKWIKGYVPVGKNKQVYINSLTGQGIDEICNLLHKFIGYQTSITRFPYTNAEDVKQDIFVLAIEAIPNYNINKSANILTFLQNHVKNRLINRCKYVSEKKRTATYFKTTMIKVRCPNCLRFFVVEKNKNVDCKYCGEVPQVKKWKKYNIPILPMSFSSLEDSLDDNSTGIIDFFSDENSLNSLLYGSKSVESIMNARIDFGKKYNKLDNTNRIIISMLLQGHSAKDISKEVKITEKELADRILFLQKDNIC